MASEAVIEAASTVVGFTAHDTVKDFNISPPAFLARHFASAKDSQDKTRSPAPKFLATGAIVFDGLVSSANMENRSPKVLLIQRAPHDSMPLQWETPGGGCDDDDPSVLYSCARELREEAGLKASSLGPLVKSPDESIKLQNQSSSGPAEGEPSWGERMGGQFFFTRRGFLVCKFYFIVHVPEDQITNVVLDPNEHAGYVWATEEEVKNKKMDGLEGIDLNFTTKHQWEVILEAFKLWNMGSE
jgi:8-oxo-dGTP pyrophosphatase MutT (NUDIX family)